MYFFNSCFVLSMTYKYWRVLLITLLTNFLVTELCVLQQLQLGSRKILQNDLFETLSFLDELTEIHK